MLVPLLGRLLFWSCVNSIFVGSFWMIPVPWYQSIRLLNSVTRGNLNGNTNHQFIYEQNDVRTYDTTVRSASDVCQQRKFHPVRKRASASAPYGVQRFTWKRQKWRENLSPHHHTLQVGDGIQRFSRFPAQLSSAFTTPHHDWLPHFTSKINDDSATFQNKRSSQHEKGLIFLLRATRTKRPKLSS